MKIFSRVLLVGNTSVVWERNIPRYLPLCLKWRQQPGLVIGHPRLYTQARYVLKAPLEMRLVMALSAETCLYFTEPHNSRGLRLSQAIFVEKTRFI